MSNDKKLKVGEQIETTIRSWEFGKTPTKGTKYIRIRFNNYITKTIWPWSPKAQEHAIKTLETLGFKGKDLSMLKNDDALDTKKIFLVTIDEVKTSNGKNYYEASWVNDPDKIFGGFNSELSKDELDEFSMDVSGYIADAKDIDPPASSENYSSSTTYAADDIPF